MKKTALLLTMTALFSNLGHTQEMMPTSPSQMKYGNLLQLQCIGRNSSSATVYDIIKVCKNVASVIKLQQIVQPVETTTNSVLDLVAPFEPLESVPENVASAPVVIVNDNSAQLKNEILNSAASGRESAAYKLHPDVKVKTLSRCLAQDGLVTTTLSYDKVFMNCFAKAVLAN